MSTMQSNTFKMIVIFMLVFVHVCIDQINGSLSNKLGYRNWSLQSIGFKNLVSISHADKMMLKKITKITFLALVLSIPLSNLNFKAFIHDRLYGSSVHHSDIQPSNKVYITHSKKISNIKIILSVIIEIVVLYFILKFITWHFKSDVSNSYKSAGKINVFIYVFILV